MANKTTAQQTPSDIRKQLQMAKQARAAFNADSRRYGRRGSSDKPLRIAV